MKIEVKKKGTLTGHSGAVYALEQGASSSLLYSGSSDKFIALWNLDTLQPEKFAAQFPSIVYAICHIPQKNILLVGTDARPGEKSSRSDSMMILTVDTKNKALKF